jgi:hypothetical protein
LEDANFGEDVEVSKLQGFLILTKGIALGGFGDKLATGVFIKDVEAESVSYMLVASGTREVYVKPLCDETCLSRASPICESFSEWPGFRHSSSKS